MRKDWKEMTLNELGIISRGKSRHRPRNAPHLYGGKYPLIQTGDIQNAQFYITKYSQTYSDDGLAQSKLWNKGTLCISIVGANTAATAILGFDACFPDSVIGFNSDEKISDTKFVKYSLELLRVHMKSISEGTARENLSLEKLLTVKIPVPPLATQQKIASILSAYDDLIENNLRRIKLLEEMAAITYKEWFVNFTIDGQKLEIDAETGLPFGWELISVGNILAKTKTSLKIKSSDILTNGNFPVIDQGREFIAGYTNDQSAIIDDDIAYIIFGDHTRILKFVNFPFARGADGTQLIKSNNERLPQHLLFQMLKNIDLSNYHYARHFKFLKDSEILLPKKEVADKFEMLVMPNYCLIRSLQNQNRLLKEARDILLPRLMSGEIELT